MIRLALIAGALAATLAMAQDMPKMKPGDINTGGRISNINDVARMMKGK